MKNVSNGKHNISTNYKKKTEIGDIYNKGA